jgi:TPR repeat protein
MAAANANQPEGALRLMEECAEEGDSVACFMSALWYRNGEGGPMNPERSAHWIARLLELAEKGNFEAQWEVGQSYRFGNLLPRDVQRANYWLERAAAGGYGEAQHHLASYFELGWYGYPLDPAKVAEWYQRAFNQEHPETLYLFAMRKYVNGQPTEEAISLLRKAADKGFEQAQHMLDPNPPRQPMTRRSAKFSLAMDAYNIDKPERALRLMEECAEEGNSTACFNTALWYRAGRGTPVNTERSSQWIVRLVELAEHGNVEAQRNVELCYRFGEILPRDIEQANEWLERAAAGGCAQAQHDLASYYEDGRYGYPVDTAKAAKWYQRALDQEHPETLYLFAIENFADGQPTEKAIGLLRKAADKGFKQAEFLLQSCLH